MGSTSCAELHVHPLGNSGGGRDEQTSYELYRTQPIHCSNRHLNFGQRTTSDAGFFPEPDRSGKGGLCHRPRRCAQCLLPSSPGLSWFLGPRRRHSPVGSSTRTHPRHLYVQLGWQLDVGKPFQLGILAHSVLRLITEAANNHHRCVFVDPEPEERVRRG